LIIIDGHAPYACPSFIIGPIILTYNKVLLTFIIGQSNYVIMSYRMS